MDNARTRRADCSCTFFSSLRIVLVCVALYEARLRLSFNVKVVSATGHDVGVEDLVLHSIRSIKQNADPSTPLRMTLLWEVA